MPDEPARERRDFLFQEVGRRIGPGVEAVPAAEFDRAQLRMVEGVPVDEALALERAVVPLHQLQVVFERMLAVPVDELVVRDAGLPLRAPDLHRPGEHAAVVVHPGIEIAGDDFLRVVAEIVVGGNRRIAGDPGAVLADLLVGPQVFRRHLLIGKVGVRPQQDAAVGVKGDGAGDVRMPRDESGDGGDLRFRGGEGTGAGLFVLGTPVRRESCGSGRAVPCAPGA